jgi:hypothetical protein
MTDAYDTPQAFRAALEARLKAQIPEVKEVIAV